MNPRTPAALEPADGGASSVPPPTPGGPGIRTRRILIEGLAATGVLAIALVLFFWDAVFAGRALLPVDLIYSLDPVWTAIARPDLRLPSNPNLTDVVDQFYPWRAYFYRWLGAADPGAEPAWTAWRAYLYYWLGQNALPLWNPHILGGVTFVGNDQSAMFFPINWFGYLFPLPVSFVATAIARLLIAGLSTYAYLRVIGRGLAASYFGALTYTFCGFLVVWLGHNIVSVAMWLPLLLLVCERIFSARRLVWTGLLALGVGLQLLAGHPETSFYVLLTAATYAVFLAGRARRRDPDRAWRGVLLFALGTGLGFGIGAVQLLPFVEQLLQSSLAGDRAGQHYTASPLYDPVFWNEVKTVITQIYPTAFGFPIELQSGVRIFHNALGLPGYHETASYVGILPLLLAGVGAVCCRRDSRVVFWVVAGLVSLGVVFRAPIANAVNYLPLFNIAWNHRLRLVFTFALIVLAASGLDWLIDRARCRTAGERRAVARAGWVAAGTGAAALIAVGAGYVALTTWPVEAIDRGRRLGLNEVETLVPLFTERLAPANWRMFLPGALLLALALGIWLARARRVGRAALAALVPVVATAELFAYGQGYNPTIDPADIFPETSATYYLRENAGNARVVGLGNALIPNSAMLFGLQDVRGYEVVWLARMKRLLTGAEGRRPFYLESYLLFENASSRLLDLLGVRYVINNFPDAEPDPDRFRLVHAQIFPPEQAGGETNYGVRIYENRDALPRAFIVGAARALANPNEILSVYGQDGRSTFDPRREVLLEAAQAPPTEGLAPGAADARIVTYRPNRVTLEATLEGDGYLVLTDAYDRGWWALVDGQSTPIYQADYAFRAIRLGPGEHRVDFLYRPISLVAGGALTAVCLILIVGAGLARRPLGCALDRLARVIARRERIVLAVAGAATGLALAIAIARPFVADLIPPSSGSLVQDDRSGTVYLYDGARKRRIPNPTTLNCIQPPDQRLVRWSGLTSVPEGPPIPNRAGCSLLPPAGALIQPEGQPAVYFSTGDALRLIPTPRTLECVRQGTSIETVASAYVERAAVGPPLDDGELCD